MRSLFEFGDRICCACQQNEDNQEDRTALYDQYDDAGNDDTRKLENTDEDVVHSGHSAAASRGPNPDDATIHESMGGDKPPKASTISNLPTLAVCQKLSGNEELNRAARNLNAREKAFGKKHRLTLQAKSDFAQLLCELGDFTNAEAMQRKVLATWECEFGFHHAETLDAKDNLATTLARCGDLQAAGKLAREVLDARVRNLGNGDLATLHAKSNLAKIRHECGDLSGAETLQREALNAWEQRKSVGGIFPSGTNADTVDPKVIAAKNNLATILNAQKRWGEAEKLETEVLEIASQALGFEHPETLKAKCNLANTLSAKGNYGSAATLEQDVLDVRLSRLGVSHPDTLRSRNNLAITLVKRSDLDEAERVQNEALETSTQFFGTDHPETLRMKLNQAALLARRGNHASAAALRREVLEASVRLLGPGHEISKQAQRDTSKVRFNAGKAGACCPFL